MTMSFWRNYYHITWSTDERLPLILPAFEKQLYRYLVKKASEFEVFVYALNGTQDHIHMVAAIPPKHAVADIVKNIKGGSAHYVNHVICPGDRFTWERGYGCLTIGEKQRPAAESYVRNQKQHHAENTINAWLERWAEEDEGPGSPSEGSSRVMREKESVYGPVEESPF
jgi:putative transposase